MGQHPYHKISQIKVFKRKNFCESFEHKWTFICHSLKSNPRLVFRCSLRVPAITRLCDYGLRHLPVPSLFAFVTYMCHVLRRNHSNSTHTLTGYRRVGSSTMEHLRSVGELLPPQVKGIVGEGVKNRLSTLILNVLLPHSPCSFGKTHRNLFAGITKPQQSKPTR